MPLSSQPSGALRAAFAGLLVLTLGACDGSDPGPEPKKRGWPVAQGADQPGSVADIGQPLRLTAGPAHGPQGLLRVVVAKVVRGDTRDLRRFTLDKAVRSSGIYYVHVRLRNDSDQAVPHFRPTLYGQVSETEVVPAVRFGSSFTKCSPALTTARFKPGRTQSTCYMFLVPDGGELQAVQYRFERPRWPALTWRMG